MKHWPPYTTPNEKPYALNHVKVLEHGLQFCTQFRTALQAGGSVGYWPLRMSGEFQRVITFEPEPLMLQCLRKNMAELPNVEVRGEALGAWAGRVGIERRGFGSHRTVTGDDVKQITIDSLGLQDVDLIQLDIEGAELEALKGAEETLDYCRPVLMVEILIPDSPDAHDLQYFLMNLGYKQQKQIGRDYVFTGQ